MTRKYSVVTRGTWEEISEVEAPNEHEAIQKVEMGCDSVKVISHTEAAQYDALPVTPVLRSVKA